MLSGVPGDPSGTHRTLSAGEVWLSAFLLFPCSHTVGLVATIMRLLVGAQSHMVKCSKINAFLSMLLMPFC